VARAIPLTQISDNPNRLDMSHHETTSENGNGAIRIRGARVHNLKNVDVDVPRDQLVVVTGPSGSGKSSLALDTVFAEGQRQYIESLSVYARQFLHQLERPDVDIIDGLQPTICVDQSSRPDNPRSTVATITEIYDYLRLLMARLGTPHCHQCSQPILQQTTEQIQESIVSLPDRTKVLILAPMVRGRKGQHRDVFARIRRAGLLRARVDSVVYELDNLPELDARKSHQIEAVVDRVIIREGIEGRVGDSVKLAVKHGDGLAMISYLDENGNGKKSKQKKQGVWRDRAFSTLYACPQCDISFEEFAPRTFSFNSPYGACPVCEGMGARVEFDPEQVLPDGGKSLAEGAVLPWKGATPAAAKKQKQALDGFLKANKIAWETPLDDLSDEKRHQLLYGDDGEFVGVLMLLEKEFATTTRTKRISQLETFRGSVVCQACSGSRLRPEARGVEFHDQAIHDITAMSITEASAFFKSLDLGDDEQLIAKPIFDEILNRLTFLEKVGVPYLTLDRSVDTLSGGELQRVRLATGIGSGLVGVCYVLDEPSIGLHPRDNDRLIETLRDLQGQGNTLLVVEHDEAMMRVADRIIDMGPTAGASGGRIIAEGTPDEIADNPDSITGQYLAGSRSIPVPKKRRRTAKSRSLLIDGVSINNLSDVSARIPLGVFVCVTGVSGSGKTSLINDTLAPALMRRLNGGGGKPGEFSSLRGVSQIEKVVAIDQSPIGRTPRSSPATYTGVFDEIRKAFATTRLAKQRGYGVGRFSFNVKGGRCEDCQGQGVMKIEMNFLPDFYTRCNTCQGARFNRPTLQVRYRNKSIADVLDMSVEESLGFFENFSAIHRTLKSLADVGLGYLALGQPSNTLSGGEAQRIKLATQLARVESGDTLYLLDEPTTGLHFDDIRRLLEMLGRLVDKGNTVLVIEHHLDVIKSADWVIDMGPEGGDAGGEVVACGTPEDIAAVDASHTGRFLQPLVAK